MPLFKNSEEKSACVPVSLKLDLSILKPESALMPA
jgi:hypothetical protein